MYLTLSPLCKKEYLEKNGFEPSPINTLMFFHKEETKKGVNVWTVVDFHFKLVYMNIDNNDVKLPITSTHSVEQGFYDSYMLADEVEKNLIFDLAFEFPTKALEMIQDGMALLPKRK